MSCRATKFHRREIRKAVGQDALDTLSEVQENIQALANSVALAHTRLDDHKTRFEREHELTLTLSEWMRVQDTCYHSDFVWLQALRNSGWLGRLKMLVTGQ